MRTLRSLLADSFQLKKARVFFSGSCIPAGSCHEPVRRLSYQAGRTTGHPLECSIGGTGSTSSQTGSLRAGTFGSRSLVPFRSGRQIPPAKENGEFPNLSCFPPFTSSSFLLLRTAAGVEPASAELRCLREYPRSQKLDSWTLTLRAEVKTRRGEKVPIHSQGPESYPLTAISYPLERSQEPPNEVFHPSMVGPTACFLRLRFHLPDRPEQ